MAVRGVRSSCETLATKSRRILIRPPEVGDVVEHDDGPVARAARRRRRPRHDRPRRVARRRELQARRLVSGQGRRDELRDARVADRLEVQAARDEVVGLQHLAGRLVDELDPALRADDHHALDHPRDNRLHPGPLARQRGQALPRLLQRIVERTGDDAQLVFAVRGRRRREVAGAVPAGRVDEPIDARLEIAGQQAGEQRRRAQGQQRRPRRRQHSPRPVKRERGRNRGQRGQSDRGRVDSGGHAGGDSRSL